MAHRSQDDHDEERIAAETTLTTEEEAQGDISHVVQLGSRVQARDRGWFHLQRFQRVYNLPKQHTRWESIIQTYSLWGVFHISSITVNCVLNTRLPSAQWCL